jgi:lipopolysaccharide export system protein LptA
MVSSTVKVAALLLLVGTSAGRAQERPPPVPCSLAFDSTLLNPQTNRGEFRGIRITCEGITIAADEAAASEVVPEEGQWEMRGNVRIETSAATITADSATFGFTDSDLLFGELVGAPVVLEDYGSSENGTLRARATAERIYYDNVARTARLRMREGTSLVGTNFEMRGCGDISYDLESGDVESIATCGERFDIRYLPPSDEAQDSGEAPPNDE